MASSQPSPRFVITIDGPAGSGKSTLARRLATLLRIQYLDTGAMYRGLTLKALRHGVDVNDGPALGRLARRTRLAWRRQGRGACRLYMDGQDVSRAIRLPDTTRHVSAVSQHAQVRRWMVRQQRRFARATSIVVEGRDIGTVVFPKARYKFFLVATAVARARRRLHDLRAAGQSATLSGVAQSLRRRDTIDSHRAVSPLTCAPDAVRIDTSKRRAEETVRAVLQHLQRPPVVRSR